MNLRPKTKRRLFILLTGIALVGGVGAIAVKIQLHRLDQRRLEYRAQGMAAYHRGDYLAALENLKKYLNNNSTDAEATYGYAVSRSMVPTGDMRHLMEAKSAFNRYLELKPGDTQAEHRLLELYRQMRYNEEAGSLADRLLEKDPNDVAALEARLQILVSQSRYVNAMEISRKINDLAPLNVRCQIITYVLMQQLKEPPEKLVARADAMMKEHPGDPRFELLRAVAALAGDREESRKWLLAAASRTPPDTEFVRTLAGMFDSVGMYGEARDVLAKAASANKTDKDLNTAMVQRMWEAGEYDQALACLNTLLPPSADGDARLLGYKAITLYCLWQKTNPAVQPGDSRPLVLRPATAASERVEADMIVAALSRRPDDAVAAAWAALLKGRYSDPPLPPLESIKLYQAAMPRDPDNAIIRYFLGISYDELGESELALQAWHQAGELSRAWVDPHIMMARTLVDNGRISEAAGEAAMAADRAPRSLDVRITQAMVDYTLLPPNASPDDLNRLLDFIRAIQAESPDEPQSLPVYVALLARAGRGAEAANVVRSSLKASPPLPSRTLVKLAQISAGARLGVEDAIRDHLAQFKPANSEAAFDQAVILATIGKPLDGLKFIIAARETAKAAGDDSPEWRLAVIRYRDAVNDPGLDTAWNDIAEAYPKNLSVQRAILGARSAWSNRSLIDHTIERLRSLTGEEGIEWKLARARWNLTEPVGSADNSAGDKKGGPGAAAALMADVVRTAPNLAEPLVIWAQAMEKLGNIGSAIDRLRTAASLAPGDVSVSISLARLLQTQGKTAEARDILEHIASSAGISPAVHLQAARLLSSQGQFDSAIATLKSDGTPDGANVDRDLLLARLYQAKGQTEEAGKLYDGLLQASSVNPSIIRAVAWFHAAHRDLAKARQALHRLDDLKLPPGQKELILAAFNEDSNNPDEAIAQFRAAVQAASNDAATWKALAGFQLRRRAFDDAAKTAEQGLQNIPGNAELTSLAGIARTLISIGPSSELQQIIEALSVDPTNSDNVQAINAIAASQAARENRDQLIDRLRPIADAHPGAMAVQMLLAQKYFNANRFQEADEVATRAMQAMPTEAEPARVLALISSRMGKWDRMLTAASEWRNRSLDQPMPADLQIATAKLNMNDPGGAIAQIAPYLDQARANPDQNGAVIPLYARALVKSDQLPAAASLLEPLARNSSHWRAIALEVASDSTKDAASAGDWIEKLASLAKADSRDDQTAVAMAWYNVWRRFKDSSSLAKAKAIVQTLAALPDAPASIYLTLGVIDQGMNDLPGAEAAYRKALEIDPGQLVARNNLAYAIFLRGGDLNEARQLAEKCVAAMPADSSFQDTLARIYAGSGRLDLALNSFQNATKANPQNIEAMIGLADAQAKTGQRDKAAVTMQQVDALMAADSPALSELAKHELEEVRAAVKG